MEMSKRIIQYIENRGYKEELVDALIKIFTIEFLGDSGASIVYSLKDFIDDVMAGKISKGEDGFVTFGVATVGDVAYDGFVSNITGAFNSLISKGPIRYILQSKGALFVHGENVSFYKPIVKSKDDYEDLIEIKLSNGNTRYIKKEKLENVFSSIGFDENMLKVEDDGTIRLDYFAILTLPIRDIGKTK